ncbi:TetR/AcrR family transcriptional regulator [Amycolatopsis sp. H20-H5]|uniref:TetR/AcrR family transcriptional regulator n=1 Tax=Amycolatopsis sp. H20-H5 TaxID=3046309 RepID=UPI002DB8C641|nr:TetR/AcrR family transcriptional regulator [Amycolatopsis sp. H20-H5]MEC3976089.1 TetR/AcrR family transcriptional regulator [Amycolatopsis sp. H20-H5]
MRKIKTTRRAEIVDAALALAADRGLEALSMRAVAASMGVTPMALYGYYRGKDDLLDAVATRLLTLLPEPDPGLPGLDRLRAFAHGVRGLAGEYPAVFTLLFTRPASSGEAVRLADRLYQALLDAEVPEAAAARLERLLTTFVFGFAVSEVSGRFDGGTRNMWARRGQLGPGELPAHHRLGRLLDPPVDWAAEFEADLDDVLHAVTTATHPAIPTQVVDDSWSLGD